MSSISQATQGDRDSVLSDPSRAREAQPEREWEAECAKDWSVSDSQAKALEALIEEEPDIPQYIFGDLDFIYGLEEAIRHPRSPYGALSTKTTYLGVPCYVLLAYDLNSLLSMAESCFFGGDESSGIPERIPGFDFDLKQRLTRWDDLSDSERSEMNRAIKAIVERLRKILDILNVDEEEFYDLDQRLVLGRCGNR